MEEHGRGPELSHITEPLLKCMREAGSYIRKHHGRLRFEDVRTKQVHDYVTHVDRDVERFLVDALSGILPGSAFLAEEQTRTVSGVGSYTWVIDPLDGTTNFIHGLYPVAVSVALKYRDDYVVGAVYEVGADELFWAEDGKGAYLDDQPLRVSTLDSFDDALIATGFPYRDFHRMEAYLEVFRALMRRTAGLRRLGSAAVDLAYVACGRFEGFYEYGLNPWDVAAGGFIVRQAGGVVTDFCSGTNWHSGEEIIAASPTVYPSLREIIARSMCA